MDAMGGMARSTDDAGYFQTFDYDAFGNLKLVQDSSATLQSFRPDTFFSPART
jgi:YD repeat-containing protein